MATPAKDIVPSMTPPATTAERDRSSSILQALTEREGAILKSGGLPEPERIAQIAASVGAEIDDVVAACREYQRSGETVASQSPRPRASRDMLLSIKGKYAHVAGSSEEFLSEKHRNAANE
jgi:hypothetical protein